MGWRCPRTPCGCSGPQRRWTTSSRQALLINSACLVVMSGLGLKTAITASWNDSLLLHCGSSCCKLCDVAATGSQRRGSGHLVYLTYASTLCCSRVGTCAGTLCSWSYEAWENNCTECKGICWGAQGRERAEVSTVSGRPFHTIVHHT